MHLYHLAPLRLGAGSVIEPGNFGRLLSRYMPSEKRAFGNAWMLSRELIFEQVRPRDLPSRLSCCFALPTLRNVECYRTLVDPNFQQVLHEVAIVDESLGQHRGARSFVTMQDDVVFLETTQSKAAKYWAGDPGEPEQGYEILYKLQPRGDEGIGVTHGSYRVTRAPALRVANYISCKNCR